MRLASNKPHSPRKVPSSNKKAPPLSICKAVAHQGDWGMGRNRDKVDPKDHQKAAPKITRDGSKGVAETPPNPFGNSKTKTPAKPTKAASKLSGGIRRRPPLRRSKKIIQKGVVAINIAVMPDGTRCWAHTTLPFPPASNKTPTMAAPRQSDRRGRRTPPTHNAAERIKPLTKNLAPAIKKGGKVWIA